MLCLLPESDMQGPLYRTAKQGHSGSLNCNGHANTRSSRSGNQGRIPTLRKMAKRLVDSLKGAQVLEGGWWLTVSTFLPYGVAGYPIGLLRRRQNRCGMARLPPPSSAEPGQDQERQGRAAARRTASFFVP